TGGIFEASGQSCVAGSRVFVQAPIYEEFLAKLKARAEAITVGDPQSDDARMGPISSFTHRDRIERMVDEALADGAKALTGGHRFGDEARRHGAYYAPTLLVEVDNRSKICQNEIFGP